MRVKEEQKKIKGERGREIERERERERRYILCM